jgi:hypothetical protein
MTGLSSMFLAPANLAWSLALGAIALLWMLKLRRDPVVVGSTFLWRRLVEDRQANAPFRRVRRSLLLLVQLALAAALVAALMRPYSRGVAAAGGRVVLVVDVSASMQATDVPGSRLASALAEAVSIVERTPRETEVMVIAAGRRARLVAPLTRDRMLLVERIQSIPPTDEAGDLADALALAATVAAASGGGGARAGARPPAEVYLLSDGAAADVSGLPVKLDGLHLLRFARGGENVGITRLDVRRSGARPDEFQVFCQVVSFATARRAVTVDLMLQPPARDARPDGLPRAGAGRRLGDSRRLVLDAGQRESVVLTGVSTAPALVEAVLSGDDDLAADDRAYGVLAAAAPRRVALVAPDDGSGAEGAVAPSGRDGNRLLERTLALVPGVEIVRAAAAGQLPAGTALAVVDGPLPAALPPGPLLVVAPGRTTEMFDHRGEADAPGVLDWARSHPLMRFVVLSDPVLARAQRLAARPWMEVVVEGRDRAGAALPLVLAGEQGGRRVAVLAFHPADTDLPLSPAFPILLANAVAWLAEAPAGRTAVAAGQPIVLPVAALESGQGARAGDARAIVTGPDGEPEPVEPVAGIIRHAATSRAGFYAVRAARAASVVAVNLTDERESAIRPREEFGVAGRPVPPLFAADVVNREHRALALGLAFALLLAEWWIYHRRWAT